MAAPVLRPLSVGEVLDVSFGLYRSLFVPLVIVATVCRAIPLLLNLFFRPPESTDPMATFNWLGDHGVLFLAIIVLTLICTAFAVAATTSIVSGAYLGQTIAPRDALARAGGVIGRLIGITLVTGFVVFLGFLLLVVPGVIVMTGLILASTVVVLEPGLSATTAMGRSWELTRGFRGKVFITVFVSYLILAVPAIAVALIVGIAGLVATVPTIASTVLSGVLEIFVLPLIYVVITVLYYDLRVRKEGLDLELLASSVQPAG
ncbi:MAG: hypothetical protein ABUL71_05660 [Gemmatimonadota bacterium]